MNQKTTHKRNLKRDQPNNNILQKILTTSKLFSLKSDDYFENFPKGSLDHVAWDQGSVFFFQIPQVGALARILSIN
jgi:hypothetical protein